jgi:Dna[CI] antecedent, DciA
MSTEPEPVAIVRAWCRVAGCEMARIAVPRGLEGARLLIAVPDERWLKELEGHRDHLLERLRREAGTRHIREIEILLDPSTAPVAPRAAGPPERPAHSGPIPDEIQLAADAIPDAELGRRLASAAAALLARMARAGSPR